MKTIMLAIGNRQMEAYIQQQLKNEYVFNNPTTYRGGILNGLAQKVPDILVIRESLAGNENLSEIIYNIRVSFPEVRIVFLAGNRQPGDALLATLVNYQVFDILHGEKYNVNEILHTIRNEKSFKDVAYLCPKTIVDEKTNKKLFEAPLEKEIQEVVVEKEVVKEVVKIVEKEVPTEVVKEVIIEKEVPVPSVEEDMVINIYEEEKQKEPLIDIYEKEEVVIDLYEEQQPLIITPKKEIPKAPPIKEITQPIVKEKLSEKREETSNNKKKEQKKVETDKKGFSLFGGIRGKEENDVIDNIPIPVEKPPKKEKPKKKVEEEVTRKPQIVKQQVLTFLGGTRGVGTTFVAFNTAIHLANRGYKTLYVELKSEFSSIGYIYRLGHFDKGLDTVFAKENDEIIDMYDTFVSLSDVKKKTPKDDLMRKNYELFPDTLDILTYSQNYITKQEKEEVKINYKELCLYLALQSDFDFVIFDTSGLPMSDVEKIAILSTKTFVITTMDVCSIGQTIKTCSTLQKRIKNSDVIYYIINKAEKASLSIEDIEEWINAEDTISIPNMGREVIDGNHLGYPIYFSTGNKKFRQSFNLIEKQIFI